MSTPEGIDPETMRLQDEQRERERQELAQASAAPEPEEVATHERRAEKARYLREKLEEREAAERSADE